MKISNFKIRDRLLHKNKLDPLQNQYQEFDRRQYGHQIHSVNLQSKFQTLMDKFQLFLNFQMSKNTQNIQSSILRNSKKYEPQPDCRDRFVIIDLPSFKSNQMQLDQLEVWIGQLCTEVLSASFNYYNTGKFTYQQSKAFASQSFLRNICKLADKYEIKAEQLKFIDQKMKHDILPYLMAKYPMTDEKDSNKSLQKAIKQINNIEVLTNDFFYHTDIQFTYRENGRYDDLIMLLLNQIMSKVNQRSVNVNDQNQLTNFKDFENVMTNIFQKTYDESWMNSKFVQERILKNNTQKILESDIKNESNKKITRKQSVLIQDQKDQFFNQIKNEAEKQKYKVQVQEYTNFKIGRKISENTQFFSEDQIKSQILTIKSPAILRILTKWCDQLWEKFNNQNYFIDRTQGMRMQKGKQTNIVYPWLKVKLKTQMKAQKENIQKFLKDVQQSNYFQQMLLLKNQLKNASSSHINRIQKISGKFACKAVNNLQNFIIVYLNRLIHGLINVSKICYKQMSGMPSWPYPPNLISFKIGDLIRCKFSSKQREVLRVFQQITRINDEEPEKMKIIRIKNRLKFGTNDILINVKFNNLIMCEIQLAVSSVKTEFIKCSYNFNHYIYQIQRSIFGPISELCSIWKNLQNRSKQFVKLIQKQPLQKQTQIIQNSICHKLNQPHKLIQNDRPFICCECSKSYYQNNFMISHVKCSKCIYWKCAICLISQNKTAKNKDFFLTDNIINMNSSFLQSQKIPEQGVCLLIKKKPIKPIFFKCLEYNEKKYLFKKNYVENKTQLLAQIGSNKELKQFLKQFVVFSIPQLFGRKNVNIQIALAKTQFILPSYIQRCFKLQKETISILQQQLSLINLDVMQKATKQQKKCIKYIEFSYTNLKNMDLISKDFINLDCLNLNINLIEDISKVLEFSKLQKLYLLNNKIKTIPQNINVLTNLKQIKFNQNQIFSIPQNFCKLKSLTFLDISINQLKSLPQNFYQLQNLKQFIAKNNYFNQFPKQLAKHKQLEIINLSNNQIKVMPQQIQQLENLKQLILNNNRLLTLPTKMTNMKKLQKVNFDNNMLQSISKSICDWVNLVELRMCSNHIKDLNIHKQIQNLMKLNVILLTQNQIQQINDSFQYLKYIQRVNLFKNKIKLLSEQCFALQQLREIDLSSNKIQNISANSFKKCKKLKIIKLTNNLIQQLPNQFQNLRNICSFQIRQTKIQQFPRSFLKFQNIEVLNIYSMNIKILPQNIGDMKHLKQLNLSQNHIGQIPDSIGKLQQLKILNLRSNQIKQFNPSIFKLVQLVQLYIQYNSIEYIPDKFESLKNLKIFNFSNNKIKQIPRSITKLENLDFKFNNNLTEVLISQFIKPLNKIEINLEFWGIKQIQDDLTQHSEQITICKLKANLFENIPNIFFNYINIIKMDLSNNKLKQISRYISKWKNLNNFNLQDNLIQNLPQQIGQLSQLSVLNLKCKFLKFIPKTIQKLKLKSILLLGNNLENIENLSSIHAEEVDFSKQSLTELSQNVGDLNHVKYMNFAGNILTKLPESIAKSFQLQRLVILDQRLKNLPQNIGDLINLKQFLLYGNKLQQIPTSIGNLINLQKLSIHANCLKRIPAQIGKLKNLMDIIIRNNEIQQIPPEIGNLPKLISFSGRVNKIKQIPIEFFNQHIESFFMQDNLITKIPKEIERMKNLQQKKLFLSGNPIQQIQAQDFILQKGDSNTIKWVKEWKVKKQKEIQEKKLNESL